MDQNILIFGVAGPSGGGKTTACRNMIEVCEKNQWNVALVSQDRYYKGGNSETNYDVPDAIDWERLITDLKMLRKGKVVAAPQYDFTTHSRKEETEEIKPTPIIIVEGILIFCNETLRDMFDLKVFVDAAPALCFARRLKRDVAERGRDEKEVTERYLSHVEPSNSEYVRPTKDNADIILMNNIKGKFIGLEILISYINSMMKKKRTQVSVSRC